MNNDLLEKISKTIDLIRDHSIDAEANRFFSSFNYLYSKDKTIFSKLVSNAFARIIHEETFKCSAITMMFNSNKLNIYIAVNKKLEHEEEKKLNEKAKNLINNLNSINYNNIHRIRSLKSKIDEKTRGNDSTNNDALNTKSRPLNKINNLIQKSYQKVNFETMCKDTNISLVDYLKNCKRFLVLDNNGLTEQILPLLFELNQLGFDMILLSYYFSLYEISETQTEIIMSDEHIHCEIKIACALIERKIPFNFIGIQFLCCPICVTVLDILSSEHYNFGFSGAHNEIYPAIKSYELPKSNALNDNVKNKILCWLRQQFNRINNSKIENKCESCTNDIEINPRLVKNSQKLQSKIPDDIAYFMEEDFKEFMSTNIKDFMIKQDVQDLIDFYKTNFYIIYSYNSPFVNKILQIVKDTTKDNILETFLNIEFLSETYLTINNNEHKLEYIKFWYNLVYTILKCPNVSIIIKENDFTNLANLLQEYQNKFEEVIRDVLFD